MICTCRLEVMAAAAAAAWRFDGFDIGRQIRMEFCSPTPKPIRSLCKVMQLCQANWAAFQVLYRVARGLAMDDHIPSATPLPNSRTTSSIRAHSSIPPYFCQAGVRHTIPPPGGWRNTCMIDGREVASRDYLLDDLTCRHFCYGCSDYDA